MECQRPIKAGIWEPWFRAYLPQGKLITPEGALWRETCVRGQADVVITTAKTCPSGSGIPAFGTQWWQPTSWLPLEQRKISTTYVGPESLYLKEKLKKKTTFKHRLHSGCIKACGLINNINRCQKLHLVFTEYELKSPV